MIRLRKGLDLAIPGAAAPTIEAAPDCQSVALLGDDYPDVRLSLQVGVGDRVRAGQSVAVDRRRPQIAFAAPAAGRIAAIARGEGRRLVSVAIEVARGECVEFAPVAWGELCGFGAERTCARLLEAGLWPALRARPFGRLPTPGEAPDAIFVRAMDSNPLAVDAALVLGERREDLHFGLAALAQLTPGPVFVCSRPDAHPAPHEIQGVKWVAFEGPHPAGLVGTHIHHLLPVSRGRRVWYAGYQDVIALGHLFRTGRPDASRVVSVAGPALKRPRIVRTTLGASTEDLTAGTLLDGPCRIISGSLLSGRSASRPAAYLGRYHEQVCAIRERAKPARRAWGIPSRGRLRRVPPWGAEDAFTNELHGEPRAFYPLDLFERVFPLRLPVGALLRALAAGDARRAAEFGALELEEEDLALCSYLCAAKLNYGALLRSALQHVEEQLA